ncbi:MAG TPA: cytochrome P450 [Acidimicrobiales bacterium]|nr:cytochrome P450 [Acidimicrobiales bacterium]
MSLSAIDLDDVDRFVQGVPHEWFARLRDEAPIWWHEGKDGGHWVVTSHELYQAVTREWATFSSAGGTTPPGDPGQAPMGQILLSMDPPEHTRYRRLVSKAFTPKAIARLAPQVRDVARECIDAFVAAGGGDFVLDVAVPIPLRVISAVMGVPRSAEPQVFAWSNAIIPSDDPEYRVSPEAARSARAALSEYGASLIASRRAAPGDDLISWLIASEVDGERLTDEELQKFFILFIVGGSETTRHLLSHGVLALIEFPEQRRRVVEGSVPMSSVVEEMLRWSTPVMHHARHATRAVELAGHRIEQGQRVVLWLVSANRDGEAFAHPDELDVGRSPNPHAALGSGGPHFCLGAHLARLEAAATFEELRPVLDRLHLDGPVARLRSNFFNSIKHLPLRVQ